MDYQDFLGPDATTDNMGGTTNRIFYAPKSYLETIQDVLPLDDPGTNDLEEYAEITTPHVFKTGKGAHVIYCTLDQGEVDWGVQGELDGRSFKGELKGFHPGMSAAFLGLLRFAKNDQFLFWPELSDGKLMQLGSPRFSAEFIAEKIGSAKNSSGVRGTNFKITCMESGPVMYNTTLTMFP